MRTIHETEAGVTYVEQWFSLIRQSEIGGIRLPALTLLHELLSVRGINSMRFFDRRMDTSEPELVFDHHPSERRAIESFPELAPLFSGVRFNFTSAEQLLSTDRLIDFIQHYCRFLLAELSNLN